MSEIKVNSIKGVGASAAAITVNNSDGTCTANITNKPNRNLIINGAMNVAQRGTSSTSSGYHTVDRFDINFSGTDEAPTQAQVDVGSSDLPFTKGLTKALKITNGNQTSGAGTADRIVIRHTIEAQDVRNSGWNYTSSSSSLTLSFYVRSSVAQNFFGQLRAFDGTEQIFPFETGSLSANTWTKVTTPIAGNSNLTFDNNNDKGILIEWGMFRGTDGTNNSVTLNQWQAYSSTARTKDSTSTWYTTNDATFEITGVQLEVGSVATDFEHRSYGDELLKCQRYYEHSYNTGIAVGANSNNGGYYANLVSDPSNNAAWTLDYKVQKRAAPSLSFYADDGTANQWDYNGSTVSAAKATVVGHRNSQTHLNAYLSIGASWTPCYVLGHWIASSEL